MSDDAFHPSPVGYGFWADALAVGVVQAVRAGRLRARRPPRPPRRDPTSPTEGPHRDQGAGWRWFGAGHRRAARPGRPRRGRRGGTPGASRHCRTGRWRAGAWRPGRVRLPPLGGEGGSGRRGPRAGRAGGWVVDAAARPLRVAGDRCRVAPGRSGPPDRGGVPARGRRARRGRAALPAVLAGRRVGLADTTGPSRLAHNCSGKHAAFLLAQVATGAAPDRYLDPSGPVQRHARTLLQEWAGVATGGPGVDGCGAPAWTLPLHGVARLFGHIGSATAGTPRVSRPR